MRQIRFAVLHHNGVPGRTIDDIRHTHVDGNGWKDVGYHIVVHEDGSEHRGRADSVQGAGVAGFNEETLHICFIGNGNVRAPNLSQMVTIFARLERWCRKYLIPAERVLGHRETGPYVRPPAQPTRKLCPGNRVNMEHIRDHLRQRLTRFPPAPAGGTPP